MSLCVILIIYNCIASKVITPFFLSDSFRFPLRPDKKLWEQWSYLRPGIVITTQLTASSDIIWIMSLRIMWPGHNFRQLCTVLFLFGHSQQLKHFSFKRALIMLLFCRSRFLLRRLHVSLPLFWNQEWINDSSEKALYDEPSDLQAIWNVTK